MRVVGFFVAVELLFAFAVLLFVVVLIVVEHRMLVVVVPSHVQRDAWLYRLLKQLKPIFLA